MIELDPETEISDQTNSEINELNSENTYDANKESSGEKNHLPTLQTITNWKWNRR